ncbi:hypothetical protein [Chromohalobacter canadensis]|uniref:Uncharacterized protein n=1 Tax=Chromohalobacter canadensis TaxID=141389 RepID=A0ABZ0Y7C5_9GAMM|nr:hypothetical protein [Chromohalobacter canadensis]MCK0768882.1 hypothetical protein [Chromohalobacter canadensis]WQH07966.1 hypothetical protein SR908_10765 [Chromohalobacter canadensis]
MPQVAKAGKRRRQGATRRRRGGPARSRNSIDDWLNRLVSIAVFTALIVGVSALLVTLLWG